MDNKDQKNTASSQPTAEMKTMQRRLKNYLYSNRISQRSFARFIGKSEITISRWMSRNCQGLTPGNLKLIDTFLCRYKTPPEALQRRKHMAVFAPSAQAFHNLIFPTPSGEYIRNLIIRRIIQMDDNATKDEILKMICQIQLDNELRKVLSSPEFRKKPGAADWLYRLNPPPETEESQQDDNSQTVPPVRS